MIKTRLIPSIVCAGLVMAPLSAGAKGLSYSYAEFGYSNLDADSAEADGVTAKVSFAALDFLHVKAEYSRLFVDDIEGVSNDDVDIDRFVIGLGGNYSVTDNIDVLATASYVDAQYTGDIKEKDEGYQVEAGVRAMVGKKLELNASAIHLDVADFSDTGFGAGAVIKLKKKFALSANARHFDEDDQTEFFVGLRVNF